MGDEMRSSNVTSLNWSYWLRCPCGCDKWQMKVDAPDFTEILELVCCDCKAVAPIAFTNYSKGDKNE